MAKSIRGHNVPTGGDAPNVPSWLNQLSNSINDPVVVASATARNQALTSLKAAGHQGPVFAWRTDIENLEYHPNTGAAGEGWRYLAGRQHGATVQFARNVSAGGSPTNLLAESFTRASEGWTLNGSSNLVIPATGMYNISATITISGAAATLGRTFFQFSTTNGVFGHRTSATNEDNFGGSVIWPLSEGNQLRIQVYHAAGGSRDYSATMQIAMINAPSW